MRAVDACGDQLLDRRGEGVAVDGAILAVRRDDGRVDSLELHEAPLDPQAPGARPSGRRMLSGVTKLSIWARDSSQWATARSAAPSASPALDPLDEEVVLVGRHRLDVGHAGEARAVEGHADPRVVDQQPPEARRQIFVVRHLADDRMEALVHQRPVGGIAAADRIAEGGLRLLQQRDLVGPGVLGGEARDGGIDHRRGEEEIAHGLVGHGRHLRAPVLVQHEISLARHLAQDLAQRRARDAVALGQIRLVEIASRLERLGQDALAQILDAERLAAFRRAVHGCLLLGPRPLPTANSVHRPSLSEYNVSTVSKYMLST